MTAIPIVALDVATRAEALALVDRLGASCRFYKVGLELFTSEGPAVVEAIRGRGCDVFLDLKFHDIPNTVRKAAASAASLGVRLLTVHASGGRAMLDAAREGAEETGVLAVTVLTSLDTRSLGEAWGRPGLEVRAEVLRLAAMAAEAGLHGIVCSGQEAAAVRQAHGERLAPLVPGIRLAGAETQDQARVVTPADAVRAGARYLVLGRTVTAERDPVAAMTRVRAEMGLGG